MRYPNHWSLYLYLPTIYWWQKCPRSRGVRIITFKWVQYTCTDTMKSSNFALLRHLWWSKSVSNIITHIITVENNRVMINIVIHSFRQWAWNYHKFNDDSIIISNMSATYIYIYIYIYIFDIRWGRQCNSDSRQAGSRAWTLSSTGCIKGRGWRLFYQGNNVWGKLAILVRGSWPVIHGGTSAPCGCPPR